MTNWPTSVCTSALVLAATVGAVQAQERGAVAIEEVVVTAQKRAESIQDVPMAVTALGSATLDTYHATQLADFAAYVPGFQVVSNSGRPGEVSLTLRGISLASQQSSTVATVIDDIPIGSSSSFIAAGIIGPDVLPYDMERIEVLQGPQGTLYGASSLGGMLKYVTRTTDLNEPEFRVGTSVSSVYNGNEIGRGARARVALPLVADELAISLSGSAEYSPGYIDNVVGERAYNHGLQSGGRAALSWAPNERFSAKLAVLRDDSRFEGVGAVATTLVGHELVPTYGRYENVAVLPQVGTRQFTLYSANLSYDFGWATLTSLSGYTRSYTNGIEDSSAVFFPTFGVYVPVDQNYNLKKFSQEVRLASPDDRRLQWLVGAFYTKEEGFFSLDAGALNPATRAPAPGLNPLYSDATDSSYKEYAGFANATFDITNTWDVNAGIRVSRNEQAASERTTGAMVGGGVINTSFFPSSENVTTYSVGTSYHFTPSAMLYGRVSTGYQPGGMNQTSPIPAYPKTYNSSTLTNHEVGLKAQFLDQRLLLNLAVFHIDWADLQVDRIVGVFSYKDNRGKATSDGLELAAAYWITPDLKVGFNAAYTEAELSQDDPVAGTSKGDALPLSPKFSDTVTVDYSRPVLSDYSLQLGAIWRYVGARNTYFPNDPTSARISSYQSVDLSAGLSSGKWKANLFVRNAGNAQTYLSYTGFNGSSILQPRTIGVALDVQF